MTTHRGVAKGPSEALGNPVAVDAGSPERFGYEWDTYGQILPQHEEQFRRWLPHFAREDWKGKTFIDVGCGMGRNSYWPMVDGAGGGVAIDVNERSLAAARGNLSEFPQVEVRNQSAYEIEESGVFDIAFSIGVIHHLEFPEKALVAMVRSVKPGGRVAIWVYGYENNEWIVAVLNPLRKALFSRLPIGLVHVLSALPTAALWGLLRLGFGRIEYFRLIRGFSFPHLRSIVFDQMLPQIANYWRKDEVENLMRQAGLVDLDVRWVNQMSWAAVGRKAAASQEGAEGKGTRD